MSDDDRAFAEGETEEPGDQLAQSLTPEPAGFPGQPGPQTLIPEHSELPGRPPTMLAGNYVGLPLG